MASFADDIRNFERRTIRKLDQVQRKVVLELFTRVIYKTPVDRGRARANWQVSIGFMPTGTIEIDDASGIATVSRATAAAAGFSAGDVIFLANNLPYIRRLEEGYSQQAPAGMVALTVQEFQAVVNQIGLEVSRL